MGFWPWDDGDTYRMWLSLYCSTTKNSWCHDCRKIRSCGWDTVSPFMLAENVTWTVTGSYFDEWYPDSPLCDVRFHLVTEFPDELVRDYKDEDLCSFNSFCDVWNSHLVSRQQHVSPHTEPNHTVPVCKTLHFGFPLTHTGSKVYIQT